MSAPAGPRSAVACLTTCDVKRMGWAWADAVTPVDASFTHSCTASISQKKKSCTASYAKFAIKNVTQNGCTAPNRPETQGPTLWRNKALFS